MNKNDLIKKIVTGALTEKDLPVRFYQFTKEGNYFLNQESKEHLTEQQFVELSKKGNSLIFLSDQNLSQREIEKFNQ